MGGSGVVPRDESVFPLGNERSGISYHGLFCLMCTTGRRYALVFVPLFVAAVTLYRPIAVF